MQRESLALAFALAVLNTVTGPAIEPARAQNYPDVLELGTGADYSSGDYGQAADTDILYVPASAKYLMDEWTFRVTVPWIRIEGPRGSVVGEDMVVLPGRDAPRSIEDGLGDVVGQVSYAFFPTGPNVPFIEVSAKVKFPTADEDRGLGTGEFDYTIQADVAHRFGRVTPFAALAYRFLGDIEGFPLNNGVLATVGAGYEIDDRSSFGLIYDYRAASSDFIDDGHELTPYLSHEINAGWRATVYGVVGLSDGSPDAGLGFQVTRRLVL